MSKVIVVPSPFFKQTGFIAIKVANSYSKAVATYATTGHYSDYGDFIVTDKKLSYAYNVENVKKCVKRITTKISKKET